MWLFNQSKKISRREIFFLLYKLCEKDRRLVCIRVANFAGKRFDRRRKMDYDIG